MSLEGMVYLPLGVPLGVPLVKASGLGLPDTELALSLGGELLCLSEGLSEWTGLPFPLYAPLVDSSLLLSELFSPKHAFYH